MHNKNICLIAAVGSNGVIGNAGQLPWSLPADLAYFKKMTLNKTIVMGHNTYNSIGRALPKRRNIVLSRNPELSLPDAEVCNSIEQVFAATESESELMIIGGAKIYELFLPYASTLLLTEVDAAPIGDTKFPNWSKLEWNNISRHTHPKDNENSAGYSFCKWQR